MEDTKQDLKVTLEYLYKNLLLPVTDFHAGNCYDLYTKALSMYDNYTGSQFNMEAWKIKAQIGKGKKGNETLTAIRIMKDDVDEMYRNVFKEYIMGSQYGPNNID